FYEFIRKSLDELTKKVTSLSTYGYNGTGEWRKNAGGVELSSTEQDTAITDIIIIGGGPAGMFAAFYGGMRQASVKIIESMPQLGGQLAALYPEKYIYDVAGFPRITAQELVDSLKLQMEHFRPEICLEEKVVQVVKKDERLFEIVTDRGVHRAKAVIIT